MITPVPGIEASLVLADGRVLEYWEGGDPAGRGVIFHPGTPVTRLLGRWVHDAAVAAGVRFVAVNRPGYGGSTMTTRVPSLLNVGRDTTSLAAHLGFDGYAVVGSSGGGPFALATAVADPETVRVLGVVGGIGPWRQLEPPSANPEDRECLELLDAGDLAGAWACMDETSSLVEKDSSAPIDDALNAILGDESSVIHDESYRAIWAENVRVVLDSLDGYTCDNLAWGATWDVDPRDVVGPSLLWYGSADEHAPLKHGEWYADRIADAELIIFPGEEHFDVIDGHWPEVLAGLLRVWSQGANTTSGPHP